MKISMLVPSRNRLNLQLTFINSIITTVDDINNVNLYFGIDDDDPSREITLKMTDAIPFVNVVPIHNEGKFIGLGNMWNILAGNVTDDVFFYGGDDMIFKTQGWDTEILKEFDEKHLPDDKIKLVHCHDGHRNGELCVNAFVHRKYFELMGYFVRPEFMINWSDQWLHQSFEAFGRIYYKPEIMIFHNHWVFGGRACDDTGARMMSSDKNENNQSISDPLWNSLVQERINDVKKIGEYLNMEPNWDIVDTHGGVV